MRPLIQSSIDVSRLKEVASSWLGTPYIPDGAVKGTGCSCAMLPYSILKECGFHAEPPTVRGAMRKNEILPAMKAWLVAHEGTHFSRVESVDQVATGDVLLFDAGIGHVVLAMDSRNIIHSWQNQGVHVSDYRSGNLVKRLVGIWRPVFTG